MQPTLTTERLVLEPLAEGDQLFIQELVNTEGWLQFIGNRHIHSEADAIAYIQRIRNNPNVQYWVAKLQECRVPIGVITFIKREYLEHHDIGFACLPAHMGKGYAYEGAKAVLAHINQLGTHTQILATTLPHNTTSIELLEKLGLHYEKEIQDNETTLHVYAAPLPAIAG